MQRYFIDVRLEIGQKVQLNPQDSHHLLRVMRAKEGTTIYLVDPSSQQFIAHVCRDEGGIAEVQVLEGVQRRVELPLQVTIGCGLSKNDKLEWITQKVTECGAMAIHPLALKRDVMVWKGDKAAKKIQRLQKIAQEAAEQAHRTSIPDIEYFENLSTWLKEVQDYTHKLIAFEESAKQGEQNALARVLTSIQEGDRLAVLFGSEGGLDPAEVDLAIDHGFIPVGLGPRILRAETAPIYVMSAISYQTELLR